MPEATLLVCTVSPFDQYSLPSILKGYWPPPAYTFTAGFTLMWDWGGANGFDVDTGSTSTLLMIVCTYVGASSSIFGGAKPVDTAAREKEIEERRIRDKEAEKERKEVSTVAHVV